MSMPVILVQSDINNNGDFIQNYRALSMFRTSDFRAFYNFKNNNIQHVILAHKSMALQKYINKHIFMNTKQSQ